MFIGSNNSGSDGVLPFVEVCKEHQKGIFILVKTSNPSSGEFQDQKVDGTPLYELVGRKVAEWGEHPNSSFNYFTFYFCPLKPLPNQIKIISTI